MHPEPDRKAMKGTWHTRVVYACAQCGYDVTQTLADGLARCPECGEAVSESTCGTELKRLGPWVRAGLCVLWMSPLVIGPLGAPIATWFFFEWMENSPSPVAARLAQMNLDDGVFGWMLFGALTALGEAACYLLWWRVERWRNRRGAGRRALWRTGVVVGIQVASALAIFGVIWVYARWLA